MDREKIFHIPVVFLRPKMATCDRVDQLSVDPQPVSSPLDRSFQDVLNPKFLAHCLDFHWLTFVCEDGIAGNDKNPETREIAPMMLSVIPSARNSCSGSPLRFLNGNTAMDGLSGNGYAIFSTEAVRSGVDGNRNARSPKPQLPQPRQLRWRSWYCASSSNSLFRLYNSMGSSTRKRQNPIGSDGFINILDLMLAQILIFKTDLVFDGIIDRP